jgi:hypothetical protein
MQQSPTVSYTEHVVQRGPYHLYAREYPGEEPAIVLMHGFPDTMHLYDRLLPWLITSRRVVTRRGDRDPQCWWAHHSSDARDHGDAG